MSFKVLTSKDLEILNLSDQELVKIDSELHDVIKSSEESPRPCRVGNCACQGFRQGQHPYPSTECNNCGHGYENHR